MGIFALVDQAIKYNNVTVIPNLMFKPKMTDQDWPVPSDYFYLNDEGNNALPIENETFETFSSDHWADINVVAESDCKESEEPPPQKVKEVKRRKRKKNNGFKRRWFICILCAYRASGREILINHMLRKHSLVIGGRFFCGFCDFNEDNNDVLKLHMYGHVTDVESDDSDEEPFGLRVKRRKTFTSQQKDILNTVLKREGCVDLTTEQQLAKDFGVRVSKVQKWFARKKKTMLSGSCND